MDVFTAVALAVGAAVLVFDKLGLLDRFGIARPRSTMDALAELDLAEKALARIRAERDQAVAHATILEQQTSLEPVLQLVRQVFETQERTLEKLAHFNGALTRQEEGLREATEALRLVAGLIVGATEIPVRKPE